MESKMSLVIRGQNIPPSEESAENESLIFHFETFASMFFSTHFENSIEQKFIFDRSDLENISASVQYIYRENTMDQTEIFANIVFWNRLVQKFLPYLIGWYIREDHDQLLLKVVFKYNIEQSQESAPTTASVLFSFAQELSDIYSIHKWDVSQPS